MSVPKTEEIQATRGPTDRPRFLYKYLDRYGLDAVYNAELKITLPNQANDPLEFLPRIIAQTDQDYRELYRRTRLSVPELASIPEDQFVQNPEQWVHRLQRAFQVGASRTLGILCLSRVAKSITQWAHYADDHRGLVLELDLGTEPFETLLNHDAGRWITKVKYLQHEERKGIPLRTLLRALNPAENEDIKKILLTCAGEKSPEWSPEEEERFLVPLELKYDQNEERLTNKRMVNGRVMHFLKLNTSAMSRIILGEQASPEFENEVRKAAKLHGIGDSQIVRARIDRQRYTVIVD